MDIKSKNEDKGIMSCDTDYTITVIASKKKTLLALLKYLKEKKDRWDRWDGEGKLKRKAVCKHYRGL